MDTDGVVLFNFFTTCHWSNKTLIELNPVSKLCPINVLFNFLCIKKVSKNNLSFLSNIIRVEQNINRTKKS